MHQMSKQHAPTYPRECLWKDRVMTLGDVANASSTPVGF